MTTECQTISPIAIVYRIWLVAYCFNMMTAIQTCRYLGYLQKKSSNNALF